ncbi:hypothetical protein OSL60_26225, partial [Escherichia coli]|nr:hypothetical protein [Escherichia coli]
LRANNARNPARVISWLSAIINVLIPQSRFSPAAARQFNEKRTIPQTKSPVICLPACFRTSGMPSFAVPLTSHTR